MFSLVHLLLWFSLGFLLLILVQVIRLLLVDSEAAEIDLREIEEWDSAELNNGHEMT